MSCWQNKQKAAVAGGGGVAAVEYKIQQKYTWIQCSFYDSSVNTGTA
jgi:hypothetical protein